MPAKSAPIADPYLTLGLEPGATMAEVKRAYRQLAKTFHPDSAGEKAIPRFLAIQAAYDQIRTGRVVLGGTRAGRSAAPASPAAAPSEPWRADPARARAARERARAGGTASKNAAGSKASSGTGGATGQGTGGRASTGTSGARPGTRRRATRKATMGSTSYDEARDPADATWSGASWYGPSTGEYWIVNPREYADPRKHGPDYQQRARRPAQEGAGQAEQAPNAEAAAADDQPRATASPPQAPRARPTPRSTRWQDAATGAGWATAGEARGPAPEPDPGASAGLRWLGDQADDPVRRLGLALVAWPPIGLATAALIGVATGCATFGAQCDGAEPMLPWLAQAMILGLLLLLPALSRILAVGTAAVLVALAPITAFLLAAGGGDVPQAGAALAVLLATTWAVGVALAIALRVRRTPASAAGGRGARP